MRGWIGSRGDCSDLGPFLKAWACLVDTQCGLNLGCPGTPELGGWLEERAGGDPQGNAVDVLFGCALTLPRLMVSPLKAGALLCVRAPGLTTADGHRF